jgi:hypothetical protein
MKIPYHSRCSSLAGASGLFFLGLSLSALAQPTSQSSTSSSSAVPIGIFIIWLCARRRKKPIGGWLAFFYYQVAAGLLVTTIFTISGLHNFNPRIWHDQFLYVLFIISNIPGIIVFLCLACVSAGLLYYREWKWVLRVRIILIAYVVCSAVEGLIDYWYFTENLPIDIYGLIFPSISLAYFYVSKRVKHVYMTHDWSSPNAAPSPSNALVQS